MRSSAVILARSTALLRTSASPLSYHTFPVHSPARLTAVNNTLFRSAAHTQRRRLATITPSPSAPDSSAESVQEGVDAPHASSEPPPPEDPDKPKQRKSRVAAFLNKDPEPVELPEDLDILWSPESEDVDVRNESVLPPSDVLDDALHKLLITLHPQTQHRATYSTPSGRPIEPTLALYCPIEGGEYVIDATVRELARRTGTEVLVLDAVQLAAGEWGQFGPAANSLVLPRNPLHFPSALTPTSSNARPVLLDEEDEETNGPPQFFSRPQQMTLTVMTPPIMQGRAILTSPSRRSSPPSKVKVFFDTLVNSPSKIKSGESPSPRPRLIYIRDFPTLAPTAAAWYPPLLSAVRERRRGPISRPSSPVTNPMTIIFGVTPSLTPPPSRDAPGTNNFISLSRRASPQSVSDGRSSRDEWGEDEAAEKSRERRLRERLKKWERGDSALYHEIPKLSSTKEGESSDARPDIIVIGGPNGMPALSPVLGSSPPSSPYGELNDLENDSFFRTSILVPGVRSSAEERAVRIARRREINELTMRMGIGAAGGVLERESAISVHVDQDVDSDKMSMWEDWGNRVEEWSNVRRIADRAIGNTMSAGANPPHIPGRPTLDPTTVSWTAVHKAWAVYKSFKDLRKTWLKESSLVGSAGRGAEEEAPEAGEEQQVDEVVERVRNESELDPHEQRLLPCIVDSASMPTSFNQVHLPAHTIDSVRTIVSLPLLHPQAFQHGILKEHGMTGCLLFGPPGTGKTLVVRALAKEAGCRMIAISPSDVMDMYVGEGEKLVRAVFSLARRLSPCVVFLDEIDALFGARMSARESGGAFAHRGVITEFMQEMDGLKTSKDDRVIVIGATNRPFDLDDAVLRRLPRRLLVDLPGEKEREEILKILLRDELLADDVDIQILAKKTETFSGSDLKHLCVSAALDAVKQNVHLPWAIPLHSEGAFELAAAAPTTSQPADASAAMSSLSSESLSRSIRDVASVSATNDNSLPEVRSRVLHLRNFTKALKEITPSSSESLGSLAELRKWNDEFGEGRRDHKRRQVWGKGQFGFINHPGQVVEPGKVLSSSLDAGENGA